MHVTVRLYCHAGSRLLFPRPVVCMVSCFSEAGSALFSACILPARYVAARQIAVPDTA